MSSLEAKRLYYDTNTGLMPIIQALIAPPVSEEDGDTERRVRREKTRERKQETKKEGLDLHPYYKKKGRSHNHDYCDACLEGGNLLCCDTCEASFHLECNDPPLHVDEIPLDMWQCRRCTKLQTENKSPLKKNNSSTGGGKSGKRRKSTNSNNSATSSAGHSGGVSKMSASGTRVKDSQLNNHNDSGDSDRSSVSAPRGRGRPRKHPVTPVVPKPSDKEGNQSDSDTGSVDSTRSKRFIKRRKKEPPNPPDGKNPPENRPTGSPTGTIAGKSSSGGVDHMNNNRHSSSSSSDDDDKKKTPRVTPPSTRVTPSKLDNSGSTAGHIGYLKYSSSEEEEEDSNSEKSLYFRDVIGGNKKTEEYLDENTGEIVSRSLCENEYLNKLLAKKNTTKEIDDIERINEILLKTENMRMDSNIIKKIIGCSIPDNERSDSEGDADEDRENNPYDTDPDEGTSEEDMRDKKSCGVWTERSNNQDEASAQPPEAIAHPSEAIAHSCSQPPQPSHLVPSVSMDFDHSPSVSGGGILAQSERMENGVHVTPADRNNQSSNSSSVTTHPTLTKTTSLLAPPTPPSTSVPDPIVSSSISHIIPRPPNIQLNATTIQIKQEQEEVNQEEKTTVDEELCSLIKFDSLWKEKFNVEETKIEDDVGEEEERGGGSDSYEEWEEEEEEEERMDVTQSEAAAAAADQSSVNKLPEEDKEEDNRTLEQIRQQLGRERKERSKREEDEAVKSLNEVQIDWTDKSNQSEVRNAMQVLLDAVAHSNPEQFTLGKYEDKQYDQYVWPGTDKIPDNVKVTSKRVRSLLSLVEVDSDGLVPTPVRICHSCGRTCARFFPLLGCDYCPLYFHLDCLDPPLTSPPTLTWMCPTHPQHALDRVLVREDCNGQGKGVGGLVERSEAWDAWVSRPVNEDQVTREFLSKVRVESSLSSNFQRQTARRTRLPARIPGFISHHYRKPPELTPSLQEAIQVETIKRKQTDDVSSGGRLSTKLEQEQFLRSLISLQTRLLLLSYENKCNASSTSSEKTTNVVETKTEPLESDSMTRRRRRSSGDVAICRSEEEDEDVKNNLKDTRNKSQKLCSKSIDSLIDNNDGSSSLLSQSNRNHEDQVKSEEEILCSEENKTKKKKKKKSGEMKSELMDKSCETTSVLSNSKSANDEHISLKASGTLAPTGTLPPIGTLALSGTLAPTETMAITGTLASTSIDVTESEVLGSKLDSYFRFGSDDFMSSPSPSNQTTVEEEVHKMNNFKLDDINPNNFRVEDLFITTSSLPVSTNEHSCSIKTNQLEEEVVVEVETLGKLSFLDKSIEEEIVCLDDVKEEEEEVTGEVKIEEKTKEEKKEDKRIEEDKKIAEIKIKDEQIDEEKEDKKSEVKLKTSLFVQLNEMFRNRKQIEDDNTNNVIIDLTRVQSLDPILVQVLALEHLTHLSSQDTPNLLPQQPHFSHPYGPFVPRDSNPPVRCHALLCPLSRKLSPVPMTTNCLSIGLGPTSTLDLSKYGRCSRVSSRHAVIFYEMASNTYELVNLSEFGTKVDSISYNLDPSQSSHTYRSFHYTSSIHVQRTKWRSLVSERIKQSPFLFDVKSQRLRIKEGMERRKKRRRRRADDEDSSDEEMIPLHYGETTYKCPCISDTDDSGSDNEEQCAVPSRKGDATTTSVNKTPSTSNKQSKAWESTCLVRHGSLLEFGCFKFVFSIAEHNLTTLECNSVQYNKPSTASTTTTATSLAINQTTLSPSQSSGKQGGSNGIESKRTEPNKPDTIKCESKGIETSKTECKHTDSSSNLHEEACSEQSRVTEWSPSQLNIKKHDLTNKKHDVTNKKHDVSNKKHDVTNKKHDVTNKKHDVTNNNNHNKQYKSKQIASTNAVALGTSKKKKSHKSRRRNRSNKMNHVSHGGGGSTTDTCSDNETE